MRERINRLAKGIIEDELPIVVCEPSNIDLPIKVDEAVRFEVAVNSENKVHLKGIAYSDNIRVQIVDAVFGGTKNKLVLEINSGNLKSEDKIQGSITLVTNAGEIEIPYNFYIKNTDTVLVLDSLKTVDDFLVIAKEDMNAALAIFMYKDFYKCGFMKDIRLQKIYESLNKKPDFRSNLEVFLQSMDKKEPVNFLLGTREINISSIEEKKNFDIKIYKENWGLLDIDVSTNAPYISINTAQIKNEDFKDNVFNFSFSIDPMFLEDKKNIANIRFRNGLNEKNLEIVINKNIEKEYQRESRCFERRQWILYMKLRVELELCNDKVQRNEILLKMLAVLDKLLINTVKNVLVKLLKAEVYLLLDDRASAKSIINALEKKIKENKQELRDEYLILEYMDIYIYPDAEKIKGLTKLVKDLYRRNKSIVEFVLLLSLDDAIKENPAEKQNFLKQAFDFGDRSRLLMMEYAKLLGKNPELLTSMGKFEILALCFGIRNNLITMVLSEKIRSVVRETRRINGAILNILLSIYNAIPSDELLADICDIFIRGNVRKPYVNGWYRRCIEKDIKIQGIYEYFIYSLPDKYDMTMPESVLRYFERINSLAEEFKLRIYENIVEFYPQNSEIYRAYIKRIKTFTVDNAMKLKMDEHLINIYSRILSEDDIDERLAKIIPFLMNSYRVEVDTEGVESIIVVYPELKGEKRYQLNGKSAFIAMYSENAVILTEDEKGNRYYPKDVRTDKIFNMINLVERAYEIDNKHDMYRLEALGKIVNSENVSEMDVDLIEGSLEELDVDRRFKNKVLSKLIEYFWIASQKEGSTANFELLTESEDIILDEDNVFMYCDTLINIGKTKEALDVIKNFGIEHIQAAELLSLVSKAADDENFTRNTMAIAFALYKQGEYNDRTLELLAKVYNGRTQDMYTCLKICVEKNIETYDLEERVLSQMLFINQTAELDEVFSIYAERKRVKDIIVRAYFTIKSNAFFMKGEAAKDNVFEYLENGFSDLDDTKSFPVIYMLALSKYYSTKETLNFKQTKLCEALVKYLSDIGMIFSYFKKLSKFVSVNRDILESTFVEYKSEKDEIILKSKLFPLNDEFEEEDFPNVFNNIFVKYKKIFADEIWEYQIVRKEEDGTVLLENDCVQFSKEEDAKESRFILINDMEDLPDSKEQEMKEKMIDFVYKDELVKSLFTLM